MHNYQGPLISTVHCYSPKHISTVSLFIDLYFISVYFVILYKYWCMYYSLYMNVNHSVLMLVMAGTCSEWWDPVWAGSRWSKECDSSHNSEIQLPIKLACGKQLHSTFRATNFLQSCISEKWDKLKTDLAQILKLSVIVSELQRWYTSWSEV